MKDIHSECPKVHLPTLCEATPTCSGVGFVNILFNITHNAFSSTPPGELSTFLLCGRDILALFLFFVHHIYFQNPAGAPCHAGTCCQKFERTVVVQTVPLPEAPTPALLRACLQFFNARRV